MHLILYGKQMEMDTKDEDYSMCDFWGIAFQTILLSYSPMLLEDCAKLILLLYQMIIWDVREMKHLKDFDLLLHAVVELNLLISSIDIESLSHYCFYFKSSKKLVSDFSWIWNSILKISNKGKCDSKISALRNLRKDFY